jgi:hypothetical protein
MKPVWAALKREGYDVTIVDIDEAGIRMTIPATDVRDGDKTVKRWVGVVSASEIKKHLKPPARKS